MSTIEKTIDVHVPVRTAYSQWAQFETFPQFMEGVERVEQVSSTRTHWVTKIAGVRREFDAEITEQTPDHRIEWRTINGPEQAGVVTFDQLDPTTTRVALLMQFEPKGMVETVGDATNIVEQRIEGDLERFKEFVESGRASQPYDRTDEFDTGL